jgi:hypothetical protein
MTVFPKLCFKKLKTVDSVQLDSQLLFSIVLQQSKSTYGLYKTTAMICDPISVTRPREIHGTITAQCGKCVGQGRQINAWIQRRARNVLNNVRSGWPSTLTCDEVKD